MANISLEAGLPIILPDAWILYLDCRRWSVYFYCLPPQFRNQILCKLEVSKRMEDRRRNNPAQRNNQGRNRPRNRPPQRERGPNQDTNANKRPVQQQRPNRPGQQNRTPQQNRPGQMNRPNRPAQQNRPGMQRRPGQINRSPQQNRPIARSNRSPGYADRSGDRTQHMKRWVAKWCSHILDFSKFYVLHHMLIFFPETCCICLRYHSSTLRCFTHARKTRTCPFHVVSTLATDALEVPEHQQIQYWPTGPWTGRVQHLILKVWSSISLCINPLIYPPGPFV